MVISESFRVAHYLSLKGAADTQTVADATGLAPEKVDEWALALQQENLLSWNTRPVSGWQLTAHGREQVRDHLGGALDTLQRDKILRCYSHFNSLNTALLHTCTAWQALHISSPVTPHDRSQALAPDDAMPANRRAILNRLQEIDMAIQPTAAELAEVVTWLDQYPRRLSSAMTHINAGRVQWVASPLVDSYHTVWFELHEDLLALLGLQRSS
jgi:hypothetical protein